MSVRRKEWALHRNKSGTQPVIIKPKRAKRHYSFLNAVDREFVKFFNNDTCHIDGVWREKEYFKHMTCHSEKRLWNLKQAVGDVLHKLMQCGYYMNLVSDPGKVLSEVWNEVEEIQRRFRCQEAYTTKNKLLTAIIEEEGPLHEDKFLASCVEVKDRDKFKFLKLYQNIVIMIQESIEVADKCKEDKLPKTDNSNKLHVDTNILLCDNSQYSNIEKVKKENLSDKERHNFSIKMEQIYQQNYVEKFDFGNICLPCDAEASHFNSRYPTPVRSNTPVSRASLISGTDEVIEESYSDEETNNVENSNVAREINDTVRDDPDSDDPNIGSYSSSVTNIDSKMDENYEKLPNCLAENGASSGHNGSQLGGIDVETDDMLDKKTEITNYADEICSMNLKHSTNNKDSADEGDSEIKYHKSAVDICGNEYNKETERKKNEDTTSDDDNKGDKDEVDKESNLISFEINLILLQLLQNWNVFERLTRIKVLNKLLEKGAKVDFFNSWCPLPIVGIQSGDVELVKILFDKVQNPSNGELLENWYENLLHAAVRVESLDIVKATVNAFGKQSCIWRPDTIPHRGITPFLLAVKLQLYDIVEYFINLEIKCDEISENFEPLRCNVDNDGRYASHYMAQNNDIKMAELVKMPLNVGDKKYNSPLSISVENGFDAFSEYICLNWNLDAFIQHDIYIHGNEHDNLSVLHLAVLRGSGKTINYMLSRNCYLDHDVTFKPIGSLLYRTKSSSALDALLKYCDVNYGDGKDYNVYQGTAMWKIDFIYSPQKRIQVLETFLKYGADLNNPYGCNMLEEIVKLGYVTHALRAHIPVWNIEFIRVLLENGIQPGLLCENHIIDMFIDMMEFENISFSLPSSFSVFKILLKHNMDVEFFSLCGSNNGKSILQYVVKDYRMEYLMLIMSFTCDLNPIISYCQEALDDFDDKHWKEFVNTQYTLQDIRKSLKNISDLEIGPRSLMTLSKITFRQSLGSRNPEKQIKDMHLPEVIKDFLLQYHYNLPSLFLTGGKYAKYLSDPYACY